MRHVRTRPPRARKLRPPLAILLAVTLAPVLALADDPAPPAEARAEPRAPSVVFYLIDTCRADRMSLYGNERETTPFLDSLAGRSIVFERCYSQAPWTKPSMASILTSRYPSETGIQRIFSASPTHS